MRKEFKVILFMFVFLVGLAVAGFVNAQDLKFTGDTPTTRADGDVLDLSEIDRYEVGCSSTSPIGPFDEWLISIARDDLPIGYTVTAPKDSDWWCIGFTVDTDGLVSGPSNIAYKSLENPPLEPNSIVVECVSDCSATLNFNITIGQ